MLIPRTGASWRSALLGGALSDFVSEASRESRGALDVLVPSESRSALGALPPRLLARNDGMYLKALRWKRNFFLLAHVRVVLPQLGCPLCRSQPLGPPIRRLLVLSSTRLPHSNKALTLQLVADVVAHEWEWRNLIPRFRA